MILRVSVKKSKYIETYSEFYETLQPSIYMFLELSAKNQLKIQFQGRHFGFLSYWRIKISYLIHPLSKNCNF